MEKEEWPVKRLIVWNVVLRIHSHLAWKLYGCSPLIKLFNNLTKNKEILSSRMKSWGIVCKLLPLSWQTFCVYLHQTVCRKRTNTWLNTRQIQWADVYVTGGPLASKGLLLDQGHLHLIKTELKSIVILIKGTGLDSPLYSSAPESSLGFNFIWFSASGSTSICIAQMQIPPLGGPYFKLQHNQCNICTLLPCMCCILL